MDNYCLKEKTAIITGASRGIGFAIAQQLAAHNVKLALLARNHSNLAAAQEKLGLTSENCLLLPCDVSNAASIDSAVNSTISHFGKVDILINNAGVASPFKLFQEYDYESMSKVIDVNLKGPMFMMRAILPHMVSAGQGDIININSIAGKKVYPYSSTYVASKFGLSALTESLAEEQKPNDIRFVNIYPGRVYTEMWQDLEPNEPQNPDEMLKVEDVANAVLYALKQPRHLKIPDITLLPANCD